MLSNVTEKTPEVATLWKCYDERDHTIFYAIRIEPQKFIDLRTGEIRILHVAPLYKIEYWNLDKATDDIDLDDF